MSSSSSAARTLLSPAAPPVPRRGVVRPARCSGGGGAAAVETAASGAKVCTVSNRGDSLAICRVLNGMWQTSGGWGRIDRDAAVDAMLAYADAGLSTFDMADHCINLPLFTSNHSKPYRRHLCEHVACVTLLLVLCIY
jgi:hypothetical protein